MSQKPKHDDDSNQPKVNRRNFLKSAIGTGGIAATAGVITANLPIKDAYAALLESGIRDDSVLARIKKTGKLKVGYAQTKPNFYLDLKKNELRGIFHDATEFLGEQCEVGVEYQEVSWKNATVGLRKGDYDMFASSLTYTVPRALVVDYAGPLHHKGFGIMVHKDDAGKYSRVEDFNNADVTFSANQGSSIENQIKVNFPNAKVISIPGTLAMSFEPVKNKQATAAIDGDFDIEVFASSADWAHFTGIVFETLPNTWAVRYGDPEWVAFLDMFCDRMQSTGCMRRRFAAYREELVDG
jgi:ABC-type amino acid transport substrate-binding protein